MNNIEQEILSCPSQWRCFALAYLWAFKVC